MRRSPRHSDLQFSLCIHEESAYIKVETWKPYIIKPEIMNHSKSDPLTIGNLAFFLAPPSKYVLWRKNLVFWGLTLWSFVALSAVLINITIYPIAKWETAEGEIICLFTSSFKYLGYLHLQLMTAETTHKYKIVVCRAEVTMFLDSLGDQSMLHPL